MVISSNRSPSPISNRPNPPNSRTPESGTRKSFSGNPFTKQPTIVSNRRSFNPVTPANSPADFTQKSCKEGFSSLRVSYEQKENEKDHNNLKPLRARSPVVSSSTCTKHFMAPTISAAFKIAAASPRKKILGERNEAVRVSDSISDEKLCHSEFVEEIGSKTPITLEALSMAAPPPLSSEALNILTTPKNNRSSSSIPVSAEKPLFNSMNQLDYFSAVDEIEAKPNENLISETLLDESRRVMSSTKIKAPPLSSSPLAPLDADPSAPPYDPKTNYLSPRPLFLHYRPNPRIEVLLNKETEFSSGEGGKRLEDSFSSESCSESENTEEAQDSDSRNESEDVSSEAISEEEEKETTHLLHENNDIVRVKKISNLRFFFARSKIMPLLLVLVIACLFFPVIDSPLYTSFPDHQTSSKLEASSVNIVELAKTNLDGLAYNFKLWLVKSSSTFLHVSTFKPIPIVFEELGPFLAMNLTTAALDQELLVSQILDFGEKETEVENSSLEPEKEGEMEEELKQDQNFVGFETDEKKVEEMIEEELGNKETEDHQSEFEMLEAAAPETKLEEMSEYEIKEEALVQQQQQHGNMVEIEDQSSLITEATEIELEMLEVQNAVQIEIEESIEEANTEEFGTKEIEEQSPLILQLPEVEEPVTSEAAEFRGEEANIDAELTPQISESDTPSHSSAEPEDASSILDIETRESAIHDSEEKSAQTVGGVSSVLLILMASTAYVYLRSKKASSTTTTTTTTTTVEAPVVVKRLISKKVCSSSSLSSSSGDSQHPYLERLSSQNWASSSHVEMTGQSGPLEVSTSYQHSSSCNPRESERASEAESQERKPRRNRDSFASPSQYSSGLSPSYGSFTTYEKIHNKHGYGEDEVVTPVRRSSRIRKLVTSP